MDIAHMAALALRDAGSMVDMVGQINLFFFAAQPRYLTFVCCSSMTTKLRYAPLSKNSSEPIQKRCLGCTTHLSVQAKP